MSRRDEWIEVHLTPKFLERAQRSAAKQLARYPEDDGRYTDYRSDVTREDRIEQSAGAREALAQYLAPESIPDGVKVQWDPQSDDPHLKIPEDETGDRQWVLAIGWASDFLLIGGAKPSEGPALGELRGRALKAWHIHPDKLHPLKPRPA